MTTTHPPTGRLVELAQLTSAADLLVGGTFDTLMTSDSPAVVAAIARLKGRVAAYEAGFARRVGELAAAGQSAAPTDVLTHGGRMSGREAQQAQRVADTLGTFPDLHDLLVDGSISTGHLDALAGVVKQMTPDDVSAWQAEPERLVDAARNASPEEFGRTLKRRRVVEQTLAGISAAEQEHRKNRATTSTDYGRWRLYLDADAETGARMAAAIEAEMDAMRAAGDLDALHPDLRTDMGHLRFYATQRLLSRGFQATGPNPTTGQLTEMTVTIDARTLVDGIHDHSVCELGNGEPLDLATARRLACEAGIYPVVLSGAGVVLDQGRQMRVANREQRRALRAMHRTCAIAGCSVPFARCEVHHVIPWLPVGRTDISNLVPLCLWHHHQIHDRNWMLTLDDERTLRLYLPDGTLHSEHPLVGLAPRSGTPLTDADLAGPRDVQMHGAPSERASGGGGTSTGQAPPTGPPGRAA